MIRLKDIAALAGVSIMTVSKVLRDAPDISSATKARIRKLAQEMGYVPDALAQGLRTRTTRLLGLVISTVTNPIYARIALALEERAHELGYNLVLAQSLNDPEREELCIQRLMSRRVDGLFLSPVYRFSPVAPIYEEIKRRAIPTVLLGQSAPFCSSFTTVESDDLGGGYAAARHLLELGHRRIAFFSGPAAPPWSWERCEGYKRALREAGIEPDDRFIFSGGSTIEDGARAALQMLNEGVMVTAVQAANDLIAIGAANIFLQQGLKIPEDLSLVGFGNTLLSEHFKVPLTTLRQPKFRLGMAAMEAMQKMLRGQRAENKRLPAGLIVRASTARPKQP
jgi:LacI family transcriptional regulator